MVVKIQYLLLIISTGNYEILRYIFRSPRLSYLILIYTSHLRPKRFTLSSFKMSIVARNVQAYVPVNLLEASSETKKIRVKIINRWILYNFRSGNSIELFFVDSSVSLLFQYLLFL